MHAAAPPAGRFCPNRGGPVRLPAAPPPLCPGKHTTPTKRLFCWRLLDAAAQVQSLKKPTPRGGGYEFRIGTQQNILAVLLSWGRGSPARQRGPWTGCPWPPLFMLSRPRRSGGRGCAAPLAPALPLRMEGDGRGRRKKSARPPPWTSGQPERLAVESGSPLPHDSSTNVRVCQAPLRGLAHPAAAEGTARQGPPPGRPGLSLAGAAPMWHPEARRGGAKRRPAGPQAPPGGRSPGGPKGRAPEGGRRGRGPRPGAGAQGRGRSGAEGDHREHAAAQGRPQAPAPSPRRGRGPPPQAPPARGADRRSGRRRGATRSRATGAGGAAAARGHRSDP